MEVFASLIMEKMSKSKHQKKLWIWHRDNWTCHYCGKTVKESVLNVPDKATVDHIIPVSKGGGNRVDNLVTACVQCNSRKGNGEFRPYIKAGRLYGEKYLVSPGESP